MNVMLNADSLVALPLLLVLQVTLFGDALHANLTATSKHNTVHSSP
jgi:hypothetical protein